MSAEKDLFQDKHYDHEIRLALLENTAKSISDTLVRLETKMDFNYKELKEEIKELKSEQKDIRNETSCEFKELRSEMKSQFKWILGLMGAEFVLLVGIMGAFYTNVGHCLKWF